MERLTRTGVILSLIEEMGRAGSWCGETHVQKCSYFLQAMLGVPMGFHFILYKHGPFSFELRDELTAMRADGLLSIQIKRASYGPSLTLGRNAHVVRRISDNVIRNYTGQIEFVARWLSTKGVAELERLGTALFVTVEEANLPIEAKTNRTIGGKANRTIEVRADRINQLKPHVSIDEALDAVKAVDYLYDQARELGLMDT
ncbi:MAG TPA: hypothetical protein GX507_00940 [Clostridia bacterium]|nr:hypothetical protein [Clostridia bacterium]